MNTNLTLPRVWQDAINSAAKAAGSLNGLMREAADICAPGQGHAILATLTEVAREYDEKGMKLRLQVLRNAMRTTRMETDNGIRQLYLERVDGELQARWGVPPTRNSKKAEKTTLEMELRRIVDTYGMDAVMAGIAALE
jgi:hypothetical protein